MKTLLVETNQSCNFNCEYCFYNDYGRLADVLTPQEFKDIINKESPDIVYLTGGETTSSKYFSDYINLCFEKNIKCHIFTNGWKLLNNIEMLKSLISKLESIIISLDSINDDYNIRPYQNDIYLKLKNIDKNLKKKIIVKISINYFNFNDLESTIKSILNIGIKNISINIIHNIINSKHNYELTNDILKKIFEIIEKYIIYFDKHYIDALKDFYINKNTKLKCNANNGFSFYNCQGIKYPCPSNYKNNFKCVTKECICLWEMYNEK